VHVLGAEKNTSWAKLQEGSIAGNFLMRGINVKIVRNLKDVQEIGTIKSIIITGSYHSDIGIDSD
jgi:hypothetical protein